MGRSQMTNNGNEQNPPSIHIRNFKVENYRFKLKLSVIEIHVILLGSKKDE
ncbi:unnamed protein product [Paramecium pentaurelia]|uniref:Uncharacterized protein n=1 Tax=Paramecium pentaurelia TaxID=43138 RepID=A0A8S1T2J9_9CILI|nr:unnamed protein product [Paramecium pentaurelia]